MEIEKRDMKLITGKTGQGYAQYKISLPNKWIHALELNTENRDVTISFDGNKITIEKAVK